MLGPRDLPGGFRGPHRQSPQVTGVAVFLGHVSWDRMCSLWELGPLERKKEKTQQCRSGFWTSEQLLNTDSSQSCTPNTPNSPGLWLKRLPVGGLASSMCWRSSQVFSCLLCLCFIKDLATAMFTGHGEFWIRGFLEFIYLLLLVCVPCGREDTPVYWKFKINWRSKLMKGNTGNITQQGEHKPILELKGTFSSFT